jgi:hypothetical protein
MFFFYPEIKTAALGWLALADGLVNVINWVYFDSDCVASLFCHA